MNTSKAVNVMQIPFVYFCQERYEHLVESHPSLTPRAVNILIEYEWRKLSLEKRQTYFDMCQLYYNEQSSDQSVQTQKQKRKNTKSSLDNELPPSNPYYTNYKVVSIHKPLHHSQIIMLQILKSKHTQGCRLAIYLKDGRIYTMNNKGRLENKKMYVTQYNTPQFLRCLQNQQKLFAKQTNGLKALFSTDLQEIFRLIDALKVEKSANSINHNHTNIENKEEISQQTTQQRKKVKLEMKQESITKIEEETEESVIIIENSKETQRIWQ